MPPPPWRKIALGAVIVLALLGGAAALIVPEIEEGKDERAEAERRSDAAFEAAKRRRLAREGQAAHRRGDAPQRAAVAGRASGAPAARSCTTSSARSRAMRARVRARESSTARCSRTECEINPPSQRPLERDLSVRRMDYECLAITSRDPEGRFVVGHTFDAIVDYRRFRFTWARVCRPPGEGSARPEC